MPDPGPGALYASLQFILSTIYDEETIVTLFNSEEVRKLRLWRVKEFCINVISWDLKPALYNFIAMFWTTVSYCLRDMYSFVEH